MGKQRSPRTPGLRSQLMLGLSLIVVVATVSVGAITVLTIRQQVSEVALDNGRLLGQALSSVLASAMRGQPGDQALRRRLVGGLSLSQTVQGVEVVDRQMNVLVRGQEGGGAVSRSKDLAAAINTEQQVLQVSEGPQPRLRVSTPIFVNGRVLGGVRLTMALEPDRLGWPRLFWALMIIDGVVIVLFVILVLTRYAIRPLGVMQQAAARVADGDLTVRLSEEGARELASLAASFNSMTASVQAQLERLDQQRWELAASRQHLISSERLASVGRLAAGVAHEVGNPMQSIIGFTEMLQDGRLGPGEQQDILRRIRDEAARIHHIIREQLDYARPAEQELEAVDMASAVEQSLKLVGPQQRLQEVAVERRDLQRLPPAAANTQRLIQLLVNLLLNAADAMQGQGKIVVQGARPDDERLELRVGNSGPPIPPDDRARIFEPFYSTKEPGSGTGLGLSVAQAIAESFDGSLSLAEGEPTTFVVTLPVWSA